MSGTFNSRVWVWIVWWSKISGSVQVTGQNFLTRCQLFFLFYICYDTILWLSTRTDFTIQYCIMHARLVVLESGLGLDSGLKSIIAGLGLGLRKICNQVHFQIAVFLRPYDILPTRMVCHTSFSEFVTVWYWLRLAVRHVRQLIEDGIQPFT